jgi:hypothetical protein
MHATRETILAVVSQDPARRLLILVRELQERPIVLRTESFNANVGWYCQQELALSRVEFAGLKNVLGIQVPKACERALMLSETRHDASPSILSFAEAASRRA